MRICAAVAAVVFVALGGFWLKWHLQEPVAEIVTNAIVPGSAKAVLILSDGRKVDLTDKDSLSMNLKSGAQLTNQDAQLVYQGGNMQEVVYNELWVPRGGEYDVELADGTKVALNSSSSLRYPEIFVGDERVVSLRGEAYFEVAKDAEHRFIVHTPHHSQIEVLGTSFNVEAYENDEEITTTLVEGRVNFYYNNRETQTKQLVSLQPNEKLVYQCDSHEVDLRPTSCLAETAWKDGKIVFRNTTLRDGLKTLAKRYNVEFIIKNPKGLDDPFTGTFTNQRLERILQYFSISSHIRWRYVDGGDINETKSKIEIY